MKLIDELITITNSSTLQLIKALIKLDAYVTNSNIRKVYKKNAYAVDNQLTTLIEWGLVLTKKDKSFVGRNKAVVYFNKYKINDKNKIVQLLLKEIK